VGKDEVGMKSREKASVRKRRAGRMEVRVMELEDRVEVLWGAVKDLLRLAVEGRK